MSAWPGKVPKQWGKVQLSPWHHWQEPIGTDNRRHLVPVPTSPLSEDNAGNNTGGICLLRRIWNVGVRCSSLGLGLQSTYYIINIVKFHIFAKQR
jgi:hypothetical protein